jgi:hypothetical protein
LSSTTLSTPQTSRSRAADRRRGVVGLDEPEDRAAIADDRSLRLRIRAFVALSVA